MYSVVAKSAVAMQTCCSHARPPWRRPIVRAAPITSAIERTKFAAVSGSLVRRKRSNASIITSASASVRPSVDLPPDAELEGAGAGADAMVGVDAMGADTETPTGSMLAEALTLVATVVLALMFALTLGAAIAAVLCGIGPR